MKHALREERETVADAAERQMRRWLLAHQVEARRARENSGSTPGCSLGPYIAISREAGAGGGQIARRVAAELGWDLLDKELLDHMAERFRLPRDMLEFVDETTANWLHDTFGNWLDHQVVTQDAYVEHLGKILLLGACHGEVVIVGRGAQFILPRGNGLAVRIIAPESFRIEQIVQRRGLSHEAAQRFLHETDRGRREFVRRYFHHDVAEPHLYSLLVNSEQLGPVGAASVVVEAFRQWSHAGTSEAAPALTRSATSASNPWPVGQAR